MENSPNDNPEVELPLVAGDYLFIFSDCDEDGFYIGETLDGKRGLAPSNFIEKVQNLNKETYQQIITKSLTTKFNDLQQNEPKLNKTLNNSLSDKNSSIAALSSISDIKQINLTSNNNNNKILNSQPFPINLKIDKLENNTIIVTWDPPPVLPLNSDDHKKMSNDIPEHLIANYQLYLNHELYCLIKPNQNRSITIDKIDFNKVKTKILLIMDINLYWHNLTQ